MTRNEELFFAVSETIKTKIMEDGYRGLVGGARSYAKVKRHDGTKNSLVMLFTGLLRLQR